MKGLCHAFPSKGLFAALLVTGAGVFAAAPASAASFRCSASFSINDAGPGSDATTGTPCDVAYGAHGGSAFAGASAAAGLLRASTEARTAGAGFVGSRAYGEAFDQVVVGGLGEAGATLSFRVNVEGLLAARTSGGRTLGGDPTGSSDFAAMVSLSTDRGFGGRDSLTGCVRSEPSGISVCNGVFDYGPSLSEVVDGVMTASIFAKNGDILNILMSLRTSSLAHAVASVQSGDSSADFGDTMYWDGLVFDDASRGVQLTSVTSGFDYRYSAVPDTGGGVPEPATWALMIAGFGFAGCGLRRRRASLA